MRITDTAKIKLKEIISENNVSGLRIYVAGMG
jgi:Fe-S cluster assembly iron-binding protein IscA